jgi:hypothetical protein
MQGWCGEVTVAEGEADEALLRGRRIGTLFEYSSWLIPIDWLAEHPLDGGCRSNLAFGSGILTAWREHGATTQSNQAYTIRIHDLPIALQS